MGCFVNFWISTSVYMCSGYFVLEDKVYISPNFEANVYIILKLQTWRIKYTLAPNFEANVYIIPKLQTWRIKYTTILPKK